MLFSLDKIVADVRGALGENPKATMLEEFLDVETLSLKDRILSRLRLAAESVCIEAPLECLTGFKPLPVGVRWEEGNWGWIPLPDDFLRLAIFRMSDWKRGVSAPLSSDNPMLKMLGKRWRGVGGSPSRPLCVVRRNAYCLALEFHKCRSSRAHVAEASYFPRPRLTDTHLDFPERLYHHLITNLTKSIRNETLSPSS